MEISLLSPLEYLYVVIYRWLLTRKLYSVFCFNFPFGVV